MDRPTLLDFLRSLSDKGTLEEKFSDLFNSEHLADTADIHFAVGKDSVKYSAHKLILSLQSKVFASMFYGNLAETSEIIKIPDVEPSAFLELLKFFYCGRTQSIKTDENAEYLLYVARKYNVVPFEKRLVHSLKEMLSTDSVFLYLRYARFFDCRELETACLEFIDWNVNQLLDKTEFHSLDLDILCKILMRTTLRVKEIELFQAVLKWANAECTRKELECTADNKRTVAKRAFKLIRFPIIPTDQYIRDVTLTNILTETEELALLKYYTFPSKPRTPFVQEPRRCCEEYTVDRFKPFKYSLLALEEDDLKTLTGSFQFNVDKEIFLIGYDFDMGWYWPNRPHGNQICIKVNITETNVVLATNDTSLPECDELREYQVKFKIPVRISPNVQYTAQYSMPVSWAYVDNPSSLRNRVRYLMQNETEIILNQNENHLEAEYGFSLLLLPASFVPVRYLDCKLPQTGVTLKGSDSFSLHNTCWWPKKWKKVEACRFFG